LLYFLLQWTREGKSANTLDPAGEEQGSEIHETDGRPAHCGNKQKYRQGPLVFIEIISAGKRREEWAV